jgi:hypothetical protein
MQIWSCKFNTLHINTALLFVNRHNINKFEKIKSQEIPQACKSIINSRYNPKPWSEIFNKEHLQDGDDEEEEETISEENSANIEKSKQQFLEAIIKHLPDSVLAHSLRAKVNM